MVTHSKMYEIYGKSRVHRCRYCCNFQKRIRGENDYICIAYGKDTLWNGDYSACEALYNVPFNGIRPRIYTIEEAYPERKNPSEIIEGQESIFNTSD